MLFFKTQMCFLVRKWNIGYIAYIDNHDLIRARLSTETECAAFAS